MKKTKKTLGRPKIGQHKINISFDDEVYKKIVKYKKENNRVSKSDAVRAIVKSYLNLFDRYDPFTHKEDSNFHYKEETKKSKYKT